MSVQKAKALLKSKRYGILSTHSADMPGYPFGSLTAYVPDSRGCPIFLLSGLAQHTKNILKDPKTSLTVVDVHEDIQNAARVTVLGETLRVPAAEEKTIEVFYLNFFPDAKNYRVLPDFHFYRLVPARIRYIGGFGEMGWVEANEYLT